MGNHCRAHASDLTTVTLTTTVSAQQSGKLFAGLAAQWKDTYVA